MKISHSIENVKLYFVVTHCRILNTFMPTVSLEPPGIRARRGSIKNKDSRSTGESLTSNDKHRFTLHFDDKQ